MRITKRTVEAEAPGDADRYLWDGEVKGFGVKITPSGRKVYLVQYRLGGRSGRTRRVTIGTHGRVTTETARSEARRILGEVAMGQDPAAARALKRDALSFRDALDRFFAEHVVDKRKPRTAQEYRRIADAHILPRVGQRPLLEIERTEIARLHGSMKDAPYQANRALAVLSKFFNWCEQHGLRPDNSNPCRHIEKYRERSRERFLSADEFSRLSQALIAEEQAGTASPWSIGAIRLLMLTGARLNEILTLQWAHVDVRSGLLRLPDSKTGAKVLYLSPQAIAVLEALPRVQGNPYVICGRTSGRHLVNLEKPWRRIRAKAGLDDVRLHDLRHSFAAVAAGSGFSLPMIGALLGHSQPQTTARYAHLAADPMREAVNRITETIAAAMAGGANDENGDSGSEPPATTE